MPYKDPEKAKENGRKGYLRNREAILAKRKLQPYDPVKKHNQHLKRRYGITVEDYDRMFKDQDGKCSICSKPHLIKQRMHVDHDHKTQKVRGLLCYYCNAGLGFYEKHKVSILRYLYKD